MSREPASLEPLEVRIQVEVRASLLGAPPDPRVRVETFTNLIESLKGVFMSNLQHNGDVNVQNAGRDFVAGVAGRGNVVSVTEGSDSAVQWRSELQTLAEEVLGDRTIPLKERNEVATALIFWAERAMDADATSAGVAASTPLQGARDWVKRRFLGVMAEAPSAVLAAWALEVVHQLA